MKQKLALFVLFLLTACVVNGLYAQSSASKIAKVMTDSLAYLQLTSKQASDALSLNTTAATALIQTGKKAKTDTTFRGKALAQQVMGIMKQRNAGLQKMLTPDQLKMYEQHNIERMADLQTKIMTEQLDLTEAQIPQVYRINLKETAEMMGDVSKLQDANGKLGKIKAAKSLKGDSKDKDKALKQILSSNQYSIYEKNKEEMQQAIKARMKEKK